MIEMKSIATYICASGCLLFLGSGCATRMAGFHAPSDSETASSNFSITLHCEPEDPLANWEERAQAAAEEGMLWNEDPDEILRADLAANADNECGTLLETMREGAEELHSEARFDRARNRF